jgi:hypothetical protein
LLECLKVREASWQDRWSALAAELEERYQVKDVEALQLALRLACRAHPGYEAAQYDEEITAAFARACSVLPYVKSEPQAREWFARAKSTMLRTIDEQEES